MVEETPPLGHGFNVKFYLSTWAWIGDDVHKFVADFFHMGSLPDHASHTHIVLIPKKLVPLVRADFRQLAFAMSFTKLSLSALQTDSNLICLTVSILLSKLSLKGGGLVTI
jgi:hypothetical protein